mgnify:CR=1 FL=1
MNIGYLREVLTHIEEIKVIGKNVDVDGVICNVMGIVRHGMEMTLLILQYDESFRQRIEESEEAGLFDTSELPENNRMMLRNDRKNDAINPFQSVSKVFIDQKEFEVYSSEHRRLSAQNWEHLLLIVKFLDNGWQPDGIDYQRIDMLFLTSLKLEGEYNMIPDISPGPELRFIMRPYNVVHLVEKPITLDIEGEYTDKLIFQDAETGTEHWVQINRVYLSDMWKEMDKVFTNPKLQEHMTAEEIAQARLDFEKRFSKVCPRGMYLPVIEYECEEDIFLQFYTKSFLDAKPSQESSSMAFLISPEQSVGIMGLKLKAAVIQEPVSADTKTIEAELFQYIHTTTDREIIL